MRKFENESNVANLEKETGVVYCYHEVVKSKKDKREYNNFYVIGTTRSKRTVRIELELKDAKESGSYILAMEDIFFDTDHVPIRAIEESFKNEQGETVKITKYELFVEDEDGEEYTLAVKPKSKADKTLLDRALAKAGTEKFVKEVEEIEKSEEELPTLFDEE